MKTQCGNRKINMHTTNSKSAGRKKDNNNQENKN